MEAILNVMKVRGLYHESKNCTLQYIYNKPVKVTFSENVRETMQEKLWKIKLIDQIMLQMSN